jgi:hypothetical protein
VLADGQLALLGHSGPASAGTAPQELLEALAQVPDPRDPRGRRYSLASVLAITVCTTLAGARSYAAIAAEALGHPGLRCSTDRNGRSNTAYRVQPPGRVTRPAAGNHARARPGEVAPHAPTLA